MTEKAKIELSNEEDTLERIALLYLSPMLSASFRAEVGRILEDSEKYQGMFTLSDDPASANKLFERLQEQLNTTKKALTEISNHYLTDESYEGDADYRKIAIDALAAIGGDDGYRRS